MLQAFLYMLEFSLLMVIAIGISAGIGIPVGYLLGRFFK